MTHVTCRLTAKNRDQLRNPTLDSRVWATFALFKFSDLIPADLGRSELNWTELNLMLRTSYCQFS